MDAGQSDSIVLEEEIDPNYEPTEKEVLEYATWLGMDLEAEKDLFWIAREGLKAPLPENWKPCKTTDTEEIYYFNFATGQSTWDHPCDEFYRNLYEEHKKKNIHSKKFQDTDEKKKKEKEDVAELLGRKGTGKKKKGSLTKADALGPPSLGKTNPFEKKPLPGLSSKLSALGSSGGSLGGLKSAGSLGTTPRLQRLKSETKDVEDGGNDNSFSDTTERHSPESLSKPPLGGLLSKKALPAPSWTKADSKAEQHDLSMEAEHKKQKMLEEYANDLRELESAHQTKSEMLRKRLQKELEDLEETETAKLKQRKRELEKKMNELENQFDHDENNLIRERKEKLKRMEQESDFAMSQQKQDLEKEFRTEMDKITAKHEIKLRDMNEEFKQEEQKVADKLKASLRLQTDAASAAVELQKDIDQLHNTNKLMEQELVKIRKENEQLQRNLANAEQDLNQAQRTIDDLKQQNKALETQKLDNIKPLSQECSKCTDHRLKISQLEVEIEEERKRVEVSNAEMQSLSDVINDLKRRQSDAQIKPQESGTETTVNKIKQEKESEINELKVREAKLRAEVDMMSEQQIKLNKELEDVKRNYAALQQEMVQQTQNIAATVDPSGAVAEQEELRRQYSSAQVMITNLKQDVADAQDQIAVLTKTNEQIKEQLLKESNEKKHLREQLDSTTDSFNRKLADINKEESPQVADLVAQLKSERESTKELEASYETLRNDISRFNHEKMEAERLVARLESEKSQLEAEKGTLVRRLEEIANTYRQQADSNSSSAAAELAALKWELEQLQTNLKIAITDKEHLEARLKQADVEIETLVGNNHQLEQERENELNRNKKSDVERLSLVQRLKTVEDELDEHRQKLRAFGAENADVKGQLSKSKLKEQTATTKIEQLIEECHQLELKILSQQGELEKVTKENRVKFDQLEEKAMQCNELNAEKEALQDQLNELKLSLSDMKDRMQQTTSMQAGVATLTETNIIKSQLSEYEAKLESLAREKTQLMEKNRTMTYKTSELEVKFRNLSTEHNRVETDLQHASAEIAKWKDKLAQKSKEVETLTSSLLSCESEKESLHDALKREQDGKEELLKLKSSLEKSKELLEEELKTLQGQLQNMETSQRTSGFESQSLLNKLKRSENEVNLLNKEVKTLQDGRDTLERKVKQQMQEISALEGKIRLLRSENSEQDSKSKLSEEELVRTNDIIKKLESQMAEVHLKWKRDLEEKDVLSKQIDITTLARDELETSVASLKRKLEISESKWKEHEANSSRDDFTTKMKQQQAELERENLLHTKERAEHQLKVIEKELGAIKDELNIVKTESESLRARIKTLLTEKEELQATLLSATLAGTASSAGRGDHISSVLPTADAMLVKLQLADVNKHELEAHLADVASQLEVSNRRCALLEARCRDQSIDIESLQVEISSLRSTTQKMHLSALESLSLVERLEYEHKKRALKNDYLAQLRDFQEREEQTLIRFKARLRAQHERELDDQLAELERRKQRRIEQEEALSLQMVVQMRQERELKRNELKRHIRQELQDLKHDLTTQKERQFELMTAAIRKEEETLSAQLRGSRQLTREDELVKAQTESNLDLPPMRAVQDLSQRFHVPGSPGELFNPPRRTDAPDSDGEEDEIEEPTLVSGYGTTSPQKKRPAKEPHRQKVNQSAPGLKRQKRRQQSRGSTYSKWSRRLEDEQELLDKAQAFVASQRQELKKQGKKLQNMKSEWKRDLQSIRNPDRNVILQDMKRIIDENTSNWNQTVKQMRKREAWIQNRQRKLAKMERTVDRLKSINDAGLYSRQLSAQLFKDQDNNNDYLSDDDGDTADEILSGDSNQSEIGRLLRTLEKLDEELQSDAGDLSEDLDTKKNHFLPGAGSMDPRYDEYRDNNLAVGAPNPWPSPVFSLPLHVNHSHFQPYRYAAATSLRAHGPRLTGAMDVYPSVFSTIPDMSTQPATSRWLRGHHRNHTRFSPHTSPLTKCYSSTGILTDRAEVFQRQITRWAKDRQKVQQAATKHATWLAGLCDELKEYGAKYGEADQTMTDAELIEDKHDN